MRKFYRAVVFVVFFLVCCAAAPIPWRRIRLESAGTIMLPSSWNVIAESSPALENAYGQGVYCRSLLSAQEGNDTLSILTYWPAPEKKSSEVAADIARSMRGGLSHRDSAGELQFGNIRVSSVTYNLDSQNAQKVTAFIREGKIYSIILTYRRNHENKIAKLLQRIISRWSF